MLQMMLQVILAMLWKKTRVSQNISKTKLKIVFVRVAEAQHDDFVGPRTTFSMFENEIDVYIDPKR